MRHRIPVVMLLIGVVVAGVAGSQVADAKTSGRTATASYTSPAVGAFGQGFGQCDGENGVGCVLFFTRSTERHASVSITDMSGQPVYATVVQSKTNPGGYGMVQGNQRGAFCGKTKKPVTIAGGERVAIYLYEGPGPNGCPGVASQGTVKATFTR